MGARSIEIECGHRARRNLNARARSPRICTNQGRANAEPAPRRYQGPAIALPAPDRWCKRATPVARRRARSSSRAGGTAWQSVLGVRRATTRSPECGRSAQIQKYVAVAQIDTQRVREGYSRVPQCSETCLKRLGAGSGWQARLAKQENRGCSHHTDHRIGSQSRFCTLKLETWLRLRDKPASDTSKREKRTG